MSWRESTWGEVVCEPGNVTVRRVLVRVCRQWRRILLEEPGWWSDIVWGKDGMNEAETMMCLERSLTHPLRLVWMDPENLVYYREMEDWRGKVLVENLARWETMDIGAGSEDDETEVATIRLRNAFEDPNSGGCLSLKIARIHTGSAAFFMAASRLVVAGKGLQRLSLRDESVAMSPSIMPDLLSLPPSMTTLDLKSFVLPAHVLGGILQACPALQRLTTSIGQGNDWAASDPTTAFGLHDALVAVDVRQDCRGVEELLLFFAQARLPGLRRLRIQLRRGWEESEALETFLTRSNCKLEELACEATSYCFDSSQVDGFETTLLGQVAVMATLKHSKCVLYKPSCFVDTVGWLSDGSHAPLLETIELVFTSSDKSLEQDLREMVRARFAGSGWKSPVMRISYENGQLRSGKLFMKAAGHR